MLCITFIYIFTPTLCSDLEIQTYCLSFLQTLKRLADPTDGLYGLLSPDQCIYRKFTETLLLEQSTQQPIQSLVLPDLKQT